MIRSYASQQAEDIFEGRWSGLAKPVGENLLETCFIDLRLAEICRIESDFVNTFKDRLRRCDEENPGSYVIASPSSCHPGCYEIRFFWMDNAVERLDVIIRPDGS